MESEGFVSEEKGPPVRYIYIGWTMILHQVLVGSYSRSIAIDFEFSQNGNS